MELRKQDWSVKLSGGRKPGMNGFLDVGTVGAMGLTGKPLVFDVFRGKALDLAGADTCVPLFGGTFAGRMETGCAAGPCGDAR